MSFGEKADRPLIPCDTAWDYAPRRASLFSPRRIVLARGSLDTPERTAMVREICQVYPDAEVIEALDRPHNRIDLDVTQPLDRHYAGKHTLVLGEHQSAVRLSAEKHNACPNYWHVSPYGFCPYGCTYCYLAATRGVWFSPTVKVFLNLDAMLARIDRIASDLRTPTPFYLGKLQDGLALDPLTGYSRAMVPFFAAHPHARLTLLTKAADVDNLLDLDHAGHTILSWSLNPPDVCDAFERNTPKPEARIQAMRKCASAGYPVRAVIMPIIPVPDWRGVYATFLLQLVTQVELDRITLGGVCSYPGAVDLMASKLGTQNAISQALDRHASKSRDGRNRYRPADRIAIYRHLISVVRAQRPELPVGLCLEERSVFQALDLTAAIGRCNCVL